MIVRLVLALCAAASIGCASIAPELPGTVAATLQAVDAIARAHGAEQGLSDLPIQCEHERDGRTLLVLCVVELPR